MYRVMQKKRKEDEFEYFYNMDYDPDRERIKREMAAKARREAAGQFKPRIAPIKEEIKKEKFGVAPAKPKRDTSYYDDQDYYGDYGDYYEEYGEEYYEPKHEQKYRTSDKRAYKDRDEDFSRAKYSSDYKQDKYVKKR